MKTFATLLLFLTFFAAHASAVVDPCPNDMGIYFDTNADIYEYATAPYVVVPTHVILTLPDFDALTGYEFGYDMVGNALISAVDMMGSDPTDANEGGFDFSVGLSAPLPTGPATVLATLSVFVMDTDPIAFTLRGAEPNSIAGSALPAVVLPGGETRMAGLIAWDWDTNEPGACALINGPGGILLARPKDCLLDVATDELSWDAIKSMYR